MSGKNDKKTTVVDESSASNLQAEMILTRYACIKNFNQVGREFDTHPQKVKRLWERLPEQKQKEYLESGTTIREQVQDAVIKSESNKLVDYTQTLLESRDLALKELKSRLGVDSVSKMSDKELISAIRFLNTACGTGVGEEGDASSLFSILDNAISSQISDTINRK